MLHRDIPQLHVLLGYGEQVLTSLLAPKWTMISISLFSVAEKLNFSLSSLPSLKKFWWFTPGTSLPAKPFSRFLLLIVNIITLKAKPFLSMWGHSIQQDGGVVLVSLMQCHIRLL